MIPEGNHQFLAEEGAVEELDACVRRLLACSVEEVQRVSERGREKIERDFQLSEEVEKMIGIYNETLQ